MRLKECLQDNSGFSLIEIMLAVVILALVTLPIINYYTYSSVQTIDGRERQTATMVAEDAAEELKAYSNFDQINELIATPNPAATPTPAASTDTYNVRVYYKYSFTPVAGTTVTQADIKAGLKRVVCMHVDDGTTTLSVPSPTSTPAASPTATPVIEDGPWETDASPLSKYDVSPTASPESMNLKKKIKVNGFDYLAKVHMDFDTYDSDTKTITGADIDPTKYNDYYIPKPNEVYADTNVVAAEDDEVDVAVSQIYTDLMSDGSVGTGAIEKEVTVEMTEIRKDKLKNIFVFYKPAWDAAKTEHFQITFGAGITQEEMGKINFYLTYQNVTGVTPPDATNIGTYKLKIENSPSVGYTKVYSNLNRPDHPDNSIAVEGFTLQTNSSGKYDSYVKKEKTRRIGKIYVDVFDYNETTFNEDTAIAHIESTYAE